MTSPRMAGRHVLVSGGSSGIGRAVAVACARQGARVTVIGRDSDAVDATARATGGRGIVAEMTDESAAATAVAEAVDAMGSLDGLVNCVGAATFDSVENTTLDQWDDVIRRNLTSHFLACRAALPHLRRSTASAIVNVSALAGIVPGVSSAAYSAAKAGVIQFTKTLAAQLAPAVRANSVCPGAVDTQRMRDGFLASKSDDEITAFVGRYACNRLAQPDEIANLIVFLLSSEASYLTGCNYVADGGRSYR